MASQFVHRKADQIAERFPSSFSTGKCVKTEFSLIKLQFFVSTVVSRIPLYPAVSKLFAPSVACAVHLCLGCTYTPTPLHPFKYC